jgi:hypothetical protein
LQRLAYIRIIVNDEHRWREVARYLFHFFVPAGFKLIGRRDSARRAQASLGAA